MVNIIYDGINELIEDEQDMVKTFMEESYPKMSRVCGHDDCELHVHVKVTNKGGAQQLNTLRLRFDVPSKKIFEAHDEDYDLAKATHKCCAALVTQLESSFQ